MSEKEKSKSDLQKKIEQALKRNGGESHFRFALERHLEILRDSKPEEEIESRLEMCSYLLSKMFLDKIELYPNYPFQCRLTEDSDWPIKPVPSELFGEEKQTDDERKSWFHSNLHLGDVLDCRVTSALQNSFQLKVIHKYGVSKLLDDLQLMIVLCCTKNEVEILEQKPLLVNEFVRVAVLSIDKEEDQIKIQVTLDKNALNDVIQSFKPLPKLGRISENDLAEYVFEPPDTERFSSYSEFLNSKPQFQNPHYYDKLMEECGVDSKIVCSYFPSWNRAKQHENATGQIILRNSKVEDAKALADLSYEELNDNHYNQSLEYIEKALKICPPEDPLMCKLYDIRSEIYAKQKNSRIYIESILDLEEAVEQIPKDEDLMIQEYKKIKNKFLEILTKTANAYYRNKKYKKALIGFEFILQHDKDNHHAARAVEHIKTKHADQVMNLEDKSLTDLHEKKLKLLSELKMFQ